MTTHRFYRESTGEWEDVSLERWRWEAHYLDGTVLKQFDDNGIFHQFREINQSNLHHFSMVTDGKPPFMLLWNSDYGKLIHFYFIYTLEHGSPNERHYKIYGFGYENLTSKVIMCIMPDDGLVITDDHEKVKVK